jgi:hypothetical protein
MRGLLAESAREIMSRPKDILRCFWPTAIFHAAGLALVLVLFPGEIETGRIAKNNENAVAVFIAALLALFAVTIAPGVIRWHRALITSQPTHWLPLVPPLSALLYTLLVAFTFFLFVAIQKIFSSLYQDLLMPIIGLFSGGGEIPWIFDPQKNAAFQFGELIMTFLAAFILGRLYMRLPEIAVEQPYKGARGTWSRSERWNFYCALGVLFLIPVVSDSIMNYLWAKTGELAGYLVLLPVFFILSTICWIASITLLSVAYRRNLQRRDEAAKAG